MRPVVCDLLLIPARTRAVQRALCALGLLAAACAPPQPSEQPRDPSGTASATPATASATPATASATPAIASATPATAKATPAAAKATPAATAAPAPTGSATPPTNTAGSPDPAETSPPVVGELYRGEPPGSEPRPGGVRNAVAVVKALNSRYGDCYHAELKRDKDYQGSVRLEIHVGKDGSVTRVDVTATPERDALVTCMRDATLAAHFEPPDTGSAVIYVPVRFVRQP